MIADRRGEAMVSEWTMEAALSDVTSRVIRLVTVKELAAELGMSRHMLTKWATRRGVRVFEPYNYALDWATLGHGYNKPCMTSTDADRLRAALRARPPAAPASEE
jgi:hypothetical protein